jgi:ribose 5-phosphate isomerase A
MTFNIKDEIGKEAAKCVREGMIVGLGSGSTATRFIHHLAKRCAQGLNIRAVASSKTSSDLAAELGIPLVSIDDIGTIDLTIDGADQIDPQKQMIKGLGGALVREKILASMSHEMIVIVDESKLVPHLGKILPVEVIPFGHLATFHKLKKLGYQGQWRKKANGSYFVTDNGNLIFDIHFAGVRDNPKLDHEAIIQLPGIVDTGFFFNLAGRVIVGFFDGQIVTKA